MDFVLLADSLSAPQQAAISAIVGGTAQPPKQRRWRWTDARADREARDRADTLCRQLGFDHAYLPTGLKLSDFGLLALDMDSTLVTIETIDEIADYCGRKAAVAAITEAAMRGEIADYSDSLRQRVALLKGLDAQALTAVYEERMRLSPGAQRLITSARAAGLKTLLVSGGFTFFTDRLATRLQLDFSRSNSLEIIDGQLTGNLIGPIVDAAAKAQTIADICAQLGLPTSAAIAIGDGANDLKMMQIAGLSVAYHAKAVVREQATLAIDFGGLDGLLDCLND